VLEDGVYDVFVVDVETLVGASALRLDVTILDGPHKGEVVSVRAEGLEVDEIGALGMPGTLTVVDGAPTISLEP